MEWKKTDKHVYGTIYREYCNELKVFESCTAPEGDARLGLSKPYIETVWGFEGADDGIIKSIGRKENKEQKEYDYEYFIAYYYDNDKESR